MTLRTPYPRGCPTQNEGAVGWVVGSAFKR
jgi:hypothetical protein